MSNSWSQGKHSKSIIDWMWLGILLLDVCREILRNIVGCQWICVEELYALHQTYYEYMSVGTLWRKAFKFDHWHSKKERCRFEKRLAQAIRSYWMPLDITASHSAPRASQTIRPFSLRMALPAFSLTKLTSRLPSLIFHLQGLTKCTSCNPNRPPPPKNTSTRKIKWLESTCINGVNDALRTNRFLDKPIIYLRWIKILILSLYQRHQCTLGYESVC